MFKSDVFDRRSSDNTKELNANLYNAIIGLTILWGFFANWIMIETIPYEAVASISPIVFFIGYFACVLIGSMMFTKSDNPLISFIGYNLVVVPLGLILVLTLGKGDPELVRQALELTGAATVVMLILGTIYPKFFNSIGKGLFIALLAAIIAELIMVFIFNVHFQIMNFIMIAIFCGYIGYDWARAQSIPKTIDNAIDSAASLYMDIVILFIRIYSALNRNN
jgi:FtsH-binding integral membrane protein